MDEHRVDRERLAEVSRRFFAARRPATPSDAAAYDQLEAEMIEAIGLAREGVSAAAERYRRTGCTR